MMARVDKRRARTKEKARQKEKARIAPGLSLISPL